MRFRKAIEFFTEDAIDKMFVGWITFGLFAWGIGELGLGSPNIHSATILGGLLGLAWELKEQRELIE